MKHRRARAKQCDLKGLTPESWLCVDCHVNTAPGFPTRIEMERTYNGAALRLEKPTISVQVNEHCEVYIVRDPVWKAAGMEPMGGCLCIPCLEKRLGRILKRKDFDRRHPFNSWPGTARLIERRDG